MENNNAEGKDETHVEKPNLYYPYGNFKNRELNEDPRLKVFKKEWFEGKDCLHIGCNSGILTIYIAQKFCCRRILGIDNDSDRVEEAYLNLRKIGSKSMEDGASSTGETPMELCSMEERNVSDIISFKQENIVQTQYPLEEKVYDTILCLSATQWVDLNVRANGLYALFQKIWNLLLPGGILVLEPQSLESYEKNDHASEIGFKCVEQINSHGENRFNRPILVFQK
ncbi:hypothetical protein TanjilG_06832 [Lupinus angustifolius]|uniref:RNA methyltransferase n=1 Tax=Lupinus angustifolius TaxID=3871 RepID=A0A1J7H0I6_LUPAN|nr:hypothetical protein TanjilG_06832 [Lupinus angustifolius]